MFVSKPESKTCLSVCIGRQSSWHWLWGGSEENKKQAPEKNQSRNTERSKKKQVYTSKGHSQCKAELKSSKVWQEKISPFSLAGKACRRKYYILSDWLGKKGTLLVTQAPSKVPSDWHIRPMPRGMSKVTKVAQGNTLRFFFFFKVLEITISLKKGSPYFIYTYAKTDQ